MIFFFFWLLPLGVAAADHVPPSAPILIIFYYHTNPLHITPAMKFLCGLFSSRLAALYSTSFLQYALGFLDICENITTICKNEGFIM